MALPPLAAVTTAAATPTPASSAPAVDVSTAVPPSAATISLPYAADESRPILPPRPTGRMQTARTDRSLWRNWPVIVIILAVIAIAAALVLMLWPATNTAKAAPRRLPAPAPERMDTNPLPSPIPRGSMPPPSGAPDPWSNGGGTPPPVQPVPDPDDQSAIDPDDLLQDPFANPTGPRPRARGGMPSPFAGMGGGSTFMITVAKHACDRLARCAAQSAQSNAMCAALDQFPAIPPPACGAAQRCLGQIDRLDLCGTPGQQDDFQAIVQLLTTAQDCLDATRC